MKKERACSALGTGCTKRDRTGTSTIGVGWIGYDKGSKGGVALKILHRDSQEITRKTRV